MSMRRLGLLTLLAAAMWPAVAADASLGRWGVDPLTGDPRLTILSVPSYVATDPRWRVCAANAACTPIGNGDTVSPGETALGTVFESDVTTPSGPTTERSPVWQGRVTAQSLPELHGDLRTGASVRPVAARWTGGWGDELSTNAVIACPAPTGPGCEFLPDAGATTNTGFADRPLSARHAGWYVYAVEWRTQRDVNPFGPLASVPPPGAPTSRPEPSRLAAISAPAGPIATPEPTSTPTPTPAKVAPPSVVLRQRALRNGRRVTVARVRCATRCKVELSVSDGRRTLRRTLHVRGSVPLAIVRGERLRAGRLRVTVVVDARPAITGRVRLSR